MMPPESPLPRDDPRIIAWEKYKKTTEYANARRWATNPKHVDGSHWAAFLEGYTAATKEPKP